MASLLVSSLSMAALTVAYHHARDLNREAEYRQAQIAADAALEWAVEAINANPDWRDLHTHNVDSPIRLLGNAKMTYRLLDEDGNLSDNALDAVDLLVTATAGDSRYSWRATLEPAGPALNCLSYSLAAATSDKLDVKSLASLTGHCQVAKNSSGAIYGTIEGLPETLAIPGSAVLEPYVERCTAIDRDLLPRFGSTLLFDKQLLCSQVNTISGDLNADGIYLIDCGNLNINISNSRLECTLLLLNVGSSSTISQSVYWQPATPNYPALLVDGRIDLALSVSPLQEAAIGVNFNPPAAPYRGQADNNTATSYPSQIKGLVFASDRITVESVLAKVNIIGSLISNGQLEGSGELFVVQRDTYAQYPPPGFRAFSSVRITPGTITRVASP
jgi:hypothetical protein